MNQPPANRGVKKILLGLVIGLVVALPAGAFAWNSTQIAQPFKIARCDQGDPQSCDVEVSKFSDKGINCYVAYATADITYLKDPSISCVKGN